MSKSDVKGRSAKYPELTDSQLIERFTEGRDEDAFGELVHRHGPVVMSACRRRLKNEQDCQDAFQATFLTLVTKARWIRQKSSVAGWLQQVAVRIAIDLQRANMRRRTVSDETEAFAAKFDNETTLMIEEELARLPANYRNAIVLCHLEGHTNVEAAKILAVPRTTLSSWLTKAREQLRKRLMKQGVKLTVGGLTAGLVGLGGASNPVEASLVQTTSRAATLHAAGQPVTCVAAASLAKATITKMILNKITTVALVVIMLVGGFKAVKEAHAESITIVVPPGLEDAEGNVDVTLEELANTSRVGIRTQQLFSSELFAALNGRPHYITGLRYRADGQLSGPRTASYQTYELRISTTSRSPGEMSTRFARNRGNDEVVVFDGPWDFVTQNIGAEAGPKEFDAAIDFDEPFLYNPGSGNLLLEDVGDLFAEWGQDKHQSDDPSQFQWIADVASADVATFGDNWTPVTQFVFEPVPEPSAASLVGFAAFGILLTRRRD